MPILLHLLLALSTHFALPISAESLCGQRGISNDTLLPVYMGNFFYRGPTTFALCASYCKSAAPTCRSFRYSYWADADAQYCEFFKYKLEGNVTEDDTQPYWYYDIDCAFPPYAETSPSLLTTTATVAIRTVQQNITQTQTQVQNLTKTVTETSVPPATTQTQTRIINQTETATITRISTTTTSSAYATSTKSTKRRQFFCSARLRLSFHHVPFP
ncbi:hypothetical protein GMOD_00005575 [Pyrenophora seminiperda CCB06]|uniref:Apple domain-containing protein n=1 Tax=Pyrenophora seminiperda CCB06 TaxID=1302712 RepID=A0A3M7M987_9PLEO|nr:hypothetical protein GMOD_00005575 [Pyrenophora seminiperda CCB06]